MEFLSFDNGIIKHPAYRQEEDTLVSTQTTQRRRKRQLFDNVSLVSPSYTQNLLDPENAPFVCTPGKVCFLNYDVGKEHVITIAFLNRTTVPKTFRLMPILPKFANVLRFDYEVPPRISPGLSWEVRLIFRPQENVDFSTALYVKSEEGFFAVPVMTSQKSFVFSVQPKIVDFGTVVVGEEQTRHITLRNKGALSGTAIIGGSFKPLLEMKHTNPVTGKSATFLHISPQQYKIEVSPFSAVDVAINFAPLNSVTLDTEIIFTDKSSGGEAFTIPILGSSTELPVYLTNGKIDFGACFYNEQYWDEITVVNRTNVTATADFQIPASLSNVLSFTPQRVCVQPGDQYSVQVFFSPSKKLPKNFASTIECVVRGQTLPLPLNISAILSERMPQIPTTAFDIGRVVLNTSKVLEIPVTNEASVVQLVGFDTLPPWISASPEVMRIVPHETAVFRLTVEAPQRGRFSQRLRVLNEFGDTQSISISGQGSSAPFGMTSRTLLLPPCNIHCCVSATTVLFNASEMAGEFSFSVPNACFKISPNAGILQPGESIPIAILFTAPKEFETIEISQHPAVSLRSAKTKKETLAVAAPSDSIVLQKRAMYDGWIAGEQDQQWSKHRDFRLKCDVNNGSEDSFFFTVRCCAVQPLTTVAELNSLANGAQADGANENLTHVRQAGRKTVAPPEEAEKAATEPRLPYEALIDYGKVPIHCVSLRHCQVSNGDGEHRTIRAPPLSALSPFSILTYAFNGVPKQSETNICVAFQPHKYGKFSQTFALQLETKNRKRTSVNVRVQGTCSPSQLTISMADTASLAEKEQAESLSRLVFSCTQKNDSVKKCIVLANVGSSPLAVVISASSAGADTLPNTQSNAPFLVHPRIFTLQPSCKQVVDVVFAPSDEGVYSQRLCLVAGGENREITLDARCVKDAVYALAPLAFPDGVKTAALSFSDDIGCRPEYPIALTFVEDESKTIVIGSVVNGPTGEYEIMNWEQARPLGLLSEWAVTPSTQTISSGKESRLSIQRAARQLDGAGLAAPLPGDGALFPLRFTIVLKGEAASACRRRAIYVVCTKA